MTEMFRIDKMSILTDCIPWQDVTKQLLNWNMIIKLLLNYGDVIHYIMEM